LNEEYKVFPYYYSFAKHFSFSQTEKESINDSWKFIREDIQAAGGFDFDDNSWQKVNLPHTWNAIDAYTSRQYQVPSGCPDTLREISYNRPLFSKYFIADLTSIPVLFLISLV
jgi:hypothetical protein